MANVGVILYADKGDIGNKAPDDLTKCKLVSIGDLVINSMNYGIGSFGISPYAGICSSVYVVLRSIPETSRPSFARRLLEVREFQRLAQSFGNGILEHRRAISWGTLKNLKVPVPPLDEQRQIAEYLDRETGKIDELITKQEMLIDELQQRRRAVISRLVSAGTDTKVKLKVTPFAWWGKIPDHWKVPKVSFHYSVVLGKMLDAARAEKPGDILLPYIRAGNIHEDSLNLAELNEMPFSPEEVASLNLLKDDLLVVEGGAVGVNQLVAEPLENISFQKTVNRVRALDSSSTQFLGYALDVLRYNGVIDMLCNKSTIAHLTADKLGRINIPYPPVDEQEEIVRLLNADTGRVDELASSSRKMIDVLRERRAALISAAVTGKIDVRGL